MKILELIAIDRTNRDRAAIREMLETSRWFSLGALQKRGWCAVPFLEGIGPTEAQHVAGGLRDGTMARAFTTELGAREEQYEFVVSSKALLEFERTLLLRHFLVISSPEQFALIHDGNYYWAFAAPPSLILHSFGETAVEIVERFESEAEAIENSGERRLLLDVAAKCRSTLNRD